VYSIDTASSIEKWFSENQQILKKDGALHKSNAHILTTAAKPNCGVKRYL
jgi:hypothetical protein